MCGCIMRPLYNSSSQRTLLCKKRANSSRMRGVYKASALQLIKIMHGVWRNFLCFSLLVNHRSLAARPQFCTDSRLSVCVSVCIKKVDEATCSHGEEVTGPGFDAKSVLNIIITVKCDVAGCTPFVIYI